MLTDVRLGLGYGAVAIAAVTFYYDYRQGWDQTKYFTFFAVIAYFILNGLLTLWIWGVERGKVYTGEYPGEPKPTLVRTAPPPRGPANAGQISIASSTKKHSPMYSLTVRYASADSADPFSARTLEIAAPFTRWFTAEGRFIAAPFQQWLASEIPAVAKADALKRGTPLAAVAQAMARAEANSKSAADYLPAAPQWSAQNPKEYVLHSRAWAKRNKK
jgi:hypothetical protein